MSVEVDGEVVLMMGQGNMQTRMMEERDDPSLPMCEHQEEDEDQESRRQQNQRERRRGKPRHRPSPPKNWQQLLLVGLVVGLQLVLDHPDRCLLGVAAFQKTSVTLFRTTSALHINNSININNRRNNISRNNNPQHSQQHGLFHSHKQQPHRRCSSLVVLASSNWRGRQSTVSLKGLFRADADDSIKRCDVDGQSSGQSKSNGSGSGTNVANQENNVTGNDTGNDIENDNDNDNDIRNKDEQGNEKQVDASPAFRIVARADSMLPTSRAVLPNRLTEVGPNASPPSPILDRLDLFYQAKAHQQTHDLPYIREYPITDPSPSSTSGDATDVPEDDDTVTAATKKGQQRRLISTTRTSLEDAGYQLLSRRDLDLCESLNAGYLLRLSIVPQLNELDPDLFHDFYPEKKLSNNRNDADDDDDDILFDGRVLVYWRGYSQEITQDRLLLLPKVDYLQASLVQRSAAWLKSKVDFVEDSIYTTIMTQVSRARRQFYRSWYNVLNSIDILKRLEGYRATLQRTLAKANGDMPENDNGDAQSSSSGRFLKLGRYGGSKVQFVGSPNPSDALDPFTLQQQEEDNATAAFCEYDQRMMTTTIRTDAGASADGASVRFLERVSISNLVDLFTKEGRKRFVRKFFTKSKLVEPTFQEVVVIWRSKSKPPRPVRPPPKMLLEFADMFDLDDSKFIRKQCRKQAEYLEQKSYKPTIGPMQMRTFEDVPMANLPAVFPKTKLVFRPADAFLFDMVSLFTFALVTSSIRLDNPRLDLLALVSVTLWIVRTILRYSNKLARYDLLVKTFLTSKISYRNAGALKHILSEAATQRAVSAGLTHTWIHDAIWKPWRKSIGRNVRSREPIPYDEVVRSCPSGVNDLLRTDEQQARIDPEKALQELQDLKLIAVDPESKTITNVASTQDRDAILQYEWNQLLSMPPPSSLVDDDEVADDTENDAATEDDKNDDDNDDDEGDDDESPGDKLNLKKRLQALDKLATTSRELFDNTINNQQKQYLLSSALTSTSSEGLLSMSPSFHRQAKSSNSNNKVGVRATTLMASMDDRARKNWYF